MRQLRLELDQGSVGAVVLDLGMRQLLELPPASATFLAPEMTQGFALPSPAIVPDSIAAPFLGLEMSEEPVAPPEGVPFLVPETTGGGLVLDPEMTQDPRDQRVAVSSRQSEMFRHDFSLCPVENQDVLAELVI
jgi:hypothetical protein